MQDKALAAFDALLEAMNSEKAQLSDAVVEATLERQPDKAEQLANKVKHVEHLMKQVQRLREAWERLDEAGSTSTIETNRVDERETRAGDNEDAPELAVVEQLFGGRRRRRRGPRGAVNKTPQRAYRVPILEALERLGGRGRVREVLNIVYEKMKDRLTEDDVKPLPSGSEIRWANTAMWERKWMVNNGLLRDDSPTGVWEMTDKGRAYLERVRREGEGKIC